MAIFSTGPINNSPILGVRETQFITVKIVNRDSLNAHNLTIQGYVLNGTRVMYVDETVTIAPNQVLTKNYFANLDAMEYVFTTAEDVDGEIGISVWGKQMTLGLVDAHRIVAKETYVAVR